ncbi:helix-turn-helix transcriptional regulator [Methylobacterium oryzihabitans]|uniref:Response regulator transcription factor n=1 Tax=Methylobacterium oryzihabitans TaxID=2499852 RepID=A0A3S3U9X4_9HYPH|nr:response regulator transcription factor [Methylobacterium oryzihabitans]RVU19010.1 response regulator transcription factor [Methylobacterium oryzihabitans]
MPKHQGGSSSRFGNHPAGSSQGRRSKPQTIAAAVLVGPSGMFREGLRSVLSASGIRVTASVEGLDDGETLARAVREGSVVVVDCANEVDAVRVAAAAARLREQVPSARMVVLAAADASGAAQLVALGAVNAVVSRDISAAALVRLLYLVTEDFSIISMGLIGDAYPVAADGPPQAEPGVLRPAALPVAEGRRTLSERECEILYGLVKGESNKAIARRLSIAESTVKIHVKGVLRKISVSNRTQAAIWALKHLQPGPAFQTLEALTESVYRASNGNVSVSVASAVP